MSIKYTIKQRKALKKKAWGVFAKWIRERDGRCVTCGSTDNLQAGHYCHKRFDFCEKNINTQCLTCNWRRKGNMRYYTVYMIKLYGLPFVEELLQKEKTPIKLESAEFYLGIIDKYQTTSS
jgi:hypothetical protein